MTEQNVSYGSTAVAEPPAPMLPPSYDEVSDGGNRNKLLAVGAAVGVLVLLVVAFFLMKGGGSSDESLPPIVHHAAPASTGGKTTTPADKPVALPKSYKHAVGRDPFKALYVAPAPVADEPKADTSTTTTPVVSVPGGTDTGSTGVDSGPAANFAPVWVSLVSVKGTKSATFVVGYSNGSRSKQVTYSDVAAPKRSLRTTFANVFAVLSIQDGTATVQFGDGTPFDLAPGFGNRHFVG